MAIGRAGRPRAIGGKVHPLEQRLFHAMQEKCGVIRGQTGLISLSGGPDSLALLYLLVAVREELGLKLQAIHFDHGLRPESAREAEWVADQVRALGLPVHLRGTDQLKKLGAGVPAEARRWRRREAQAILAAAGAEWIATGHQRNDQWETILLKLLRGAHLAHLTGMKWRSGPCVRPLLATGKEELRGYLRERGLTWLEDPSNRDTGYKRNRVRAELLPLLDELAGENMGPRLEALAGQAGRLEELLKELPVPAWNDPREPPHWVAISELRELPEFARAYLLGRFVHERIPGTMNFSVIEKALALMETGNPAWRLDLPGRRTLRRAGEKLLLESKGAASAPPHADRQIGGLRISFPRELEACFDCAAPESGGGMTVHNLPACASLLLRTRQPGDRFHPAWRNRPVKLKDFLRDQRFPLWERDRVPLLVLDKEVVAIYPKFVARGYDRPVAPGSSLWFRLTGN